MLLRDKWRIRDDSAREGEIPDVGEGKSRPARVVWRMRLVSKYIRELLTLNSLRPRQNGGHFADGTFNRIFVNENVRISIEISLNFVPKGPINNIPALVQIMAWRRPGDKPLSEPMMVSLPMHICVTRPQWVKWLGHFFFKMWFHFLMLFNLCAIFLYETGPIEWMFSQHCGYWWLGALAPGHWSVATVLTTHPCVSRCLRVNPWPSSIVIACVCVMYVRLSVCVSVTGGSMW